MPTEPTDQLLERCLRGDAAAQRDLYRRELPAVFNLILRLVGNRPEAEDLSQECFLRVFTRLGTYRGTAQLSTWIKRIAINLSLEYIRKRKRIVFVPVEEQHLGHVTAPASAPRVDADRLHAAIAALPQGCRLVLTLHLLEGYRHAEVANWLGISVSTSKSQYWRAKQLLRTALAPKSCPHG